ncbi:heme utilization cystosolic carrier protein HutX [Psychromonas sp. Urea-02u-13]|uniref:heme utilization cystosolic carrier protein HutX n=1 Tax=Psychromonas sp. Urea-02u-13 TaxID=2058326 RepID=UPI000C34DF0A|nr:heme utilization cystosolic carrier protein HutX [Psychromonas sp. Urea-02u-13]PKG39236.1 heme utilization cystosolic carrier protein HutX [Psychromonas sp. Urea-02u-13]
MLTEQLTEQVQSMLEQQPGLLPSEIAQQLQVSEAQVVFSFNGQMVTRVDGKQTEALLGELNSWGNVTTIMHSEGSIFEVKAPFPKGKVAHGYYNLMGKAGEIHGHLRIDLITDIALVSKPFRGNESHYFGFFTKQGNSVFKIYLGRDKKRQLLAEQVQSFSQLKTKYGQTL